jgi:hypothetical protein
MDFKFLTILISIALSGLTFSFFLGRLFQKVEELKMQTHKDTNAAHEKIRDLKSDFSELRKLLIDQLQNQR